MADDIIKQLKSFREQLVAKFDKFFEITADIQQQLQAQERSKVRQIGDDFCFANPRLHNLPYLALPRSQKIEAEFEILPLNQHPSPMSNDSSDAQLESEGFGEVLNHPPFITTVAKSRFEGLKSEVLADLKLEESNSEVEVLPKLPPVVSLCPAAIESSKNNDAWKVFDELTRRGLNPQKAEPVFVDLGKVIYICMEENIVNNEPIDATLVVHFEMNGIESIMSFDPGGGDYKVFDSYKKLFYTKELVLLKNCLNSPSFEVQFVGLGEMKFYSLFWPQPMETDSFLSTTKSPTSSLWNSFKNVKLNSISTLIELGTVIGSKSIRVLHVAASMNIVEWLEIMCSDFVYIDYTRILNYRFLSNPVISQHQTVKSLNNETIHHRILAEWAEEPPDCTYYLALSASEFFPNGKIKLSFQSHLSIFYISFEVTVKPLGVKDSILAASSFVRFKGFMVNSFIESISDALVTTELGTMFLEDGGYVGRQLLVWIQQCCNEVNDRTLYSTLFSHYLEAVFCSQQFHVTFKQCTVLVSLAEDVYFFLVNDFQTPLQRTLFSLELLRVVSYNPHVMCEFSTIHDTEKEKSAEKPSDFQQNNKRHKHQNLVQDISIQVLEKLSFVIRSTCETSSQLFEDCHSDSFSSNGWWKDDSVSWEIMIGEYCQNRQSHEVIVLFGQLFVGKMCELNGVVLAIEDFGILDLGSWMNKFMKKQKNFDEYLKILLLIVVGVGIGVCDQLLSKLPTQFRHLSREDTTHSRGEYCYGNGRVWGGDLGEAELSPELKLKSGSLLVGPL